MGAGRVLLGTLFCVVGVILVVFFVTMGVSVEDIGTPLADALFQLVFWISIHPYTLISVGTWSVLAALAIGAFIGGLLSKSAGSGAGVGALSFGILVLLQLAIGFTFDFGAWQAFWSAIGTTGLLLDLAMSAGILIVVGVIGGALTGGGE